jgi:hypothetical protein
MKYNSNSEYKPSFKNLISPKSLSTNVIHESQNNEILNSKLEDTMKPTAGHNRNNSFHINTFDRKGGSLK